MNNSPLVTHNIWSPNHSGKRRVPVDTITIHHMAGVLTSQRVGEMFASKARAASSNYGIGYDGVITQYVDEDNHPWTTGNWNNDDRAVTIEVSNSALYGVWPVSDMVLEKTIQLVADICKRRGIKQLVYTGDKRGNMTLHKWFQATACPGPYLEGKHPYIASEVNRRISTTGIKQPTVLYRVQVGAFSSYDNAVNFSKQVKAKGFDTYVVKSGSLYKVQVGAYSKKANADNMLAKMKDAGFKDAFITSNANTAPVPTPKPAPTTYKRFTVGERVIFKDPYKPAFYTGQAEGVPIPYSIKTRSFTVLQIIDNETANTKLLLKEIMSWVYAKDIR